MTFEGIVVTNQEATRAYSDRTQHGNIGFASITFGDAQGTLETSVMPVPLYYSVTLNATDAVIILSNAWDDWQVARRSLT